MELLFITLGFGGLLTTFCVFLVRREKIEDAWVKAGRLLGLGFEHAGLLGSKRSLAGSLRDSGVEVTEIDQGNWGSGVRITVAHREIPEDLELQSETNAGQVKKVFFGEDIQVRDPEFDRLFDISGSEVSAGAALGQQARMALRFLAARAMEVRLVRGRLEVIRKGAQNDSAELVKAIEEVAEAAAALRTPSRPEALAQNAREDTVAETRLRNLELLGKHYEATAVTRQAALAALADAEPKIRLAAARILGGDQERAALGELLGASDLPADLRVAALERLVEVAFWQQARPQVERALASLDAKVLRAAIAAAAKGRDQSMVPRLCELLGDVSDLELAGLAASALGEIGDPSAQASLLKLLARESPELFQGDFRTRAAVALGALGGIEAVEPLLPLANAVLPGALRDAAREAVRKIQGRLGEAGAGRLSVAEDAVAGLSLVEQAPGEPLKQKG